jgi:hypothetical protein
MRVKRFEQSQPDTDEDRQKHEELKLVIATQQLILAGDMQEATVNIANMPVLHNPKVDQLNSWTYIKAGNQDLDFARQQLDPEAADRLFDAACAKYQAGLAIKPGSGSYNLACIASLANAEDEARKWLELAKEKGVIPSIAKLTKDTDLDNVRGCTWFQDLIN